MENLIFQTDDILSQMNNLFSWLFFDEYSEQNVCDMTQEKCDISNFTSVSTFPYIWRFVVITPIIVIFIGVFTFLTISESNLSSEYKGLLVVFVPMLFCFFGLVYQHRFWKPRCRECKSSMNKIRDPDTTIVKFHYCCSRCEIYWSNTAIFPYPD